LEHKDPTFSDSETHITIGQGYYQSAFMVQHADQFYPKTTLVL
jgi:hypothetical protein